MKKGNCYFPRIPPILRIPWNRPECNPTVLETRTTYFKKEPHLLIDHLEHAAFLRYVA